MNLSTTQIETSDDVSLPVTPRRARIDPPHETRGDRALSAGIAASVDVAAASPTDERTGFSGDVLLEIVEEPAEAMVAAVVGDTFDARREQLQLQTEQLAGHLRERLRDVDRRESRLNARVAQLEGELRASRMWFREREKEFQDRESELHQQIEELQERAAPPLIATVDTDLMAEEARRADLDDREQQLALRENEVRERRFETERQAVALRHAQQLGEQQRTQQQRELAAERTRLEEEFQRRLAEREELLRSAEAILDAHSHQLEQDRAALLAERQDWQQRKTSELQEIDAQRQSTDAEANNRRGQLEARQDWIERQKAGLEQVRGEILALHRQSLEMRLLAEQLWSQISVQAAPAEITQALARLRLKLAEQYRVEEQSLQARRDELVQLGARIATQHRNLTQFRSGLREWAAARQAEIESQAAALVGRERQFATQQEEFRQAQEQWQADRRRYEQQIRDLASQLRTLPAAA